MPSKRRSAGGAWRNRPSTARSSAFSCTRSGWASARTARRTWRRWSRSSAPSPTAPRRSAWRRRSHGRENNQVDFSHEKTTRLFSRGGGGDEARRRSLAAAEHVGADLFPVDDQGERAPDPHVVERFHARVEHVEVHRVRRVVQVLRLAAEELDLLGRRLEEPVDLSRLEGVERRGGIHDLDEYELLDSDLGRRPVPRALLED